MRHHERQLRKREIEIVVVTFEVHALAQAYVADTGLRWPLLIDRERSVYAAYGMDRAGWWQVWGPRSLSPYLRDLAHGRLPSVPTDDVRQRGGDVLLDPQGRVVLHYVGETSIDRPDVAEILAAVDSYAPGRQRT